jgi:hypothetical protein
VAFLRLSRPEDELSVDALTERIDRLERHIDQAPALDARHSQPPTPATAQPQGGPTRGGSAVATAERDDRDQPDDRDPAVSEIRQADDGPAVRPALGAFLRASSPAPTSGPVPVVADSPPAAITTPPAPEEKSEPTIEPTSVGVPSIDALRTAWQDSILGGLRLKVRAIFQAGRFVEIDDGVAVLAVPNDAHLSHADPLRPELEAALTSHFGTKVGVRLISETAGRDQTDRSAPSRGQSATTPRPTASAALDEPDEFDGSDEDFADISAPIDVDDRTSAGSTGIDWARERVLKAFPGAEEV